MLSHSFLHLLSIPCSTDQTTDYKSAGASALQTKPPVTNPAGEGVQLGNVYGCEA